MDKKQPNPLNYWDIGYWSELHKEIWLGIAPKRAQAASKAKNKVKVRKRKKSRLKRK